MGTVVFSIKLVEGVVEVLGSVRRISTLLISHDFMVEVVSSHMCQLRFLSYSMACVCVLTRRL